MKTARSRDRKRRAERVARLGAEGAARQRLAKLRNPPPHPGEVPAELCWGQPFGELRAPASRRCPPPAPPPPPPRGLPPAERSGAAPAPQLRAATAVFSRGRQKKPIPTPLPAAGLLRAEPPTAPRTPQHPPAPTYLLSGRPRGLQGM